MDSASGKFSLSYVVLHSFQTCGEGRQVKGGDKVLHITQAHHSGTHSTNCHHISVQIVTIFQYKLSLYFSTNLCFARVSLLMGVLPWESTCIIKKPKSWPPLDRMEWNGVVTVCVPGATMSQLSSLVALPAGRERITCQLLGHPRGAPHRWRCPGSHRAPWHTPWQPSEWPWPPGSPPWPLSSHLNCASQGWNSRGSLSKYWLVSRSKDRQCSN